MEQVKVVNGGHFSFHGTSVTGKRDILLLENNGKIKIAKHGTFNITIVCRPFFPLKGEETDEEEVIGDRRRDIRSL